MELFGIKDGRIYYASGDKPDEKQIRTIMNALAQSLLEIKVNMLAFPKVKVEKETLTFEDREKSFIWQVQQYKDKHPDKYPNSFYTNFLKYWTESDLKPKPKMRFENEQFFEIGRRLSYSWSTRTAEQKQQYWEKDKQTA